MFKRSHSSPIPKINPVNKTFITLKRKNRRLKYLLPSDPLKGKLTFYFLNHQRFDPKLILQSILKWRKKKENRTFENKNNSKIKWGKVGG